MQQESPVADGFGEDADITIPAADKLKAESNNTIFPNMDFLQEILNTGKKRRESYNS